MKHKKDPEYWSKIAYNSSYEENMKEFYEMLMREYNAGNITFEECNSDYLLLCRGYEHYRLYVDDAVSERGRGIFKDQVL